jgi:hypothetical protein
MAPNSLAMITEPFRRYWATLVLVISLCACNACSREQVCAPGATQKCVCPTGTDGAQSCSTDGARWETCACSIPATDNSAAQGAAESPSPDATAARPVSPPRGTVNTPTNPTGGQPLGARCAVDRDCSSAECKGFKCVPLTRPKAPLGARCIVDGDCASLECKGFKCVPRK